MTKIYFFNDAPEFVARDADGKIIGVSTDGVETAVDLSPFVRVDGEQ